MAQIVTSKASTNWKGDLLSGSGQTQLDTSGAATLPMRWATRSEEVGETSNPEELIAAALSTCYAMALSFELANNGTPPDSVDTVAEVGFQAGTGITGITLTADAKVPNIDEAKFQEIAEATKRGCPVGAVLTGTEITLTATLHS